MLLNQELINQLQELFDNQLDKPVELLFFYKNDQCATCADTQQLLEEITSLSGKVQLSTYDLDKNPHLAGKYAVNFAPELVIAGREGDEIQDFGIRMVGIPAGYEFSTLIQDIMIVSKRDSGLKPAIRHELKAVDKPVLLQVFVTPT